MAKAVIFIGTVRLARLLQMKIANSYKRTGVREDSFIFTLHKGPELD